MGNEELKDRELIDREQRMGLPPDVEIDPNPRPKQNRWARNAITILIVAVAVGFMIYAGAKNAKHPAPGMAPGEVAGKQAPNFTLQDLQGHNVSLTDFRGKAVLVNFWATWCGPCKVEIPWLVELQKQYGPQGFEIIGVALDDSGHDAIQKFVKDMGMNYLVLQGKDEVGDEYGDVGLPTSYYIDRNGKIIDSTAGLVSKSEIEENIKKSLGESSTASQTQSAGQKAAS